MSQGNCSELGNIDYKVSSAAAIQKNEFSPETVITPYGDGNR
jgi:hypothetical protein